MPLGAVPAVTQEPDALPREAALSKSMCCRKSVPRGFHDRGSAHDALGVSAPLEARLASCSLRGAFAAGELVPNAGNGVFPGFRPSETSPPWLARRRAKGLEPLTEHLAV